MVALSRLKATSEAWKSNFRGLSLTFWPKYENMGSRLAKEWRVVTAPPYEAHRSTSKDARLQKQHGTAENARARTTSVSVSCACRQSGPEAGRKQVFSGSDGGLSTGVWTGRFTGFSTTSSTLTLCRDTLRAFKAAACLVCPATAPLLNATPASVHWPQQLRTFPFLNEDIVMEAACARSTPAYGIPCSCGKSVFHSFEADSMEDLAGKKVESGRNRKRMDNLPIGQVQWRWFFSSIASLLLRLLRELSLLRAALSGQQELHSRICGDHVHRDALQQSSPRQ